MVNAEEEKAAEGQARKSLELLVATEDNDNGSSSGLILLSKDELYEDKVAADSRITTSLLNCVFIPSARLPKEMVEAIAADKESLGKKLISEIPLDNIDLKKAYWEDRGFDRIRVEIFGTYCTADDRAFLDTIFGYSTMMINPGGLNLEHVVKELGAEVDWSEKMVNGIPMKDVELTNNGVYFHVKLSEACNFLGISNNTNNKQVLIQRLSRLNTMIMQLRYFKDDEELHSLNHRFRIVNNYYPFCDMSSIKNRNNVTADTNTDVIVEINKFYLQSLTQDGAISRKRYVDAYRHLSGPHNLDDLMKWLDTHTRKYIHNKVLDDLISAYLQSKLSLFGINIRHKKIQIKKSFLDRADVFEKYFNCIIRQEVITKPFGRKATPVEKIFYKPMLKEGDINEG